MPLKYHFLDYGWNYSTCQVAWKQQPITKVDFKNRGELELRSYGSRKKNTGEYMMFAFLWDSQGKRAKKRNCFMGSTCLIQTQSESSYANRPLKRSELHQTYFQKKIAIIVWNREFQLQLFDLGRIERCIRWTANLSQYVGSRHKHWKTSR